MKVALLILTAVTLLHTASGCPRKLCEILVCEMAGAYWTCTCKQTGPSGPRWNHVKCYYSGLPDMPLYPRFNRGDSCKVDGEYGRCSCHKNKDDSRYDFTYCPTELNWGFPSGAFMIKHEQSGLCVGNYQGHWAYLQKCNSNNRGQLWYNDGKYIMSSEYAGLGLHIYPPSYSSQRKAIGSAAVGWIKMWPPMPKYKTLWMFEYNRSNKYLTSVTRLVFLSNTPQYRLNLIPMVNAQGTLVSSAGAVPLAVGAKSLEAATNEDRIWMKWNLIPV